MPNCCVPGCTERKKVHCVPYTTSKWWELWLKMCPNLRKYSRRKLENTRICRKHFKREHFDHEKKRLTMDAVPLLHLSPLKKSNQKENKGKKFLEISPIDPNKPVNFKVVAPSSSPASSKNTFKSPSTKGANEKRPVKYLVCIKADPHGLPVDHNMYCLPSQNDERSACLSSPCVMCQTPSKELLSSDRTILSIEAGQQPGTPVDHNMYCGTPLPDITAGCLAACLDLKATEPLSQSVEYNMKTKPVAKELVVIDGVQHWRDIKAHGMSASISVASQTEVAEHRSIQHQEKLPYSLSADIEHSLQEQEMEDVELLDSQCVTLDDNSGIRDNVVLPTTIVAGNTLRDSQEHSIYLSPNIFNLLTSKSPLEKETLESIHTLFTVLKEQHNLSFNPIPSETTIRSRFGSINPSAELDNSTKLNIKPSVTNSTAHAPKPLHGRPAQKQTLESLVAELKESMDPEELAELPPLPAVIAADNTVCPLNPSSDDASCPPLQNPPVSVLQPSIENDMEIKRVRLSKEFSTPNERMLRMQNNMLKVKLKNLNIRYKKLKSKSDNIWAKAKDYIKSYPHLSPEGKLIVDLQIRLAGKPPKGARYSEEEKMFALKLLKITPECFKFLQPILKLPAKSTMHDFAKIA